MAERRTRGPATFRQRDATALLKAARDAGLPVYRVEVDRAGKLSVVTSQDGEEIAQREERAWDEALS